MSSQHPDSIQDANGESELEMAAKDHQNGATKAGESSEKLLLDSSTVGALKRREFFNNLLKCVEDDNLRFLQRQKERIERHVFFTDNTKFYHSKYDAPHNSYRIRIYIGRVGVKLPAIEVKYENLCVKAESRLSSGNHLPTLWNSIKGVFSSTVKLFGLKQDKVNINILEDVTGIIKPCRLTLLLGPPGSGKTTLLRALAGQLDKSLKVTGNISYNDYQLNEFVTEKTAAYISQYDLHIPDMTVRETLDFSAWCQGVGSRAEILDQVRKREEEAGIIPDRDIDLYMKTTAVGASEKSLQTDYILKIMGLEICADTMVGDAMRRGISGGQKKRLTTGVVLSRKDQRQYWSGTDESYRYISSHQLSSMFKEYHQQRESVNTSATQKSKLSKEALSFNKYSASKLELFKACGVREALLMKRSTFIYVFKTAQLSVIALVAMSVFFRTRMKTDLIHANYYMGALFFSIFMIMLNGTPEMSMQVARLPSFYKQKSYYFYPSWASAIPASILKIPISLLDSLVWICITYYGIGYTATVSRFFCQFLILCLVHHSVTSFYRFIASCAQTHIASFFYLFLGVVLFLVFGGFILPKPSLPGWLSWGFWISPLTYAEIGTAINEFLAPRWQKVKCLLELINGTNWVLSIIQHSHYHSNLLQETIQNITVGNQILITRGLYYSSYFYWISVGALLGCIVVLYIAFGLALAYRRPLEAYHESMPRKSFSEGQEEEVNIEKEFSDHINMPMEGTMAIPIMQLTVTFHNLNYYVDTPPLILMKNGGKIIYNGSIGEQSCKMVEYFEKIPGVPRIKRNCNPATWMMDVTSISMEVQLNIDFASIYEESLLHREMEDLVKQLSIPQPNSENLGFLNRFPQNSWVQFKACLWKQNIAYWRSPQYNLSRIAMTTITALIFGVLFSRHAKILNNEQDVFNVFGAMYLGVINLGVYNDQTIIPFSTTERVVMYREKFAGMYSSWSYSFAQAAIEIPYVFIQVILYTIIVYPTIDYYWTAYKFLWFMYTSFCSVLSFVYIGLLLVSLTPNVQVATVLASFFNTMQTLFSGFILPAPQTPKYWIWLYYVSPTSWTLNALLTSQYGNIDKEIKVFGETKSVAVFLNDYFGYHQDQLGLVAALLIVFPFVFVILFSLSVEKINFQKR
ncbi:hypothetical protein EJB05_05755, partial [Eragrostis curvula]